MIVRVSARDCYRFSLLDLDEASNAQNGPARMKRSTTLQEFLKQIYRTYARERPSHFAAALAYYSLFSLVPIIYIALSVAGLFIDNDSAVERFSNQLQSVIGTDGADFLIASLENVNAQVWRGPLWPRLVSFVAMLIGASLVFYQFQYTLTSIWKIPPDTTGGTKRFILNRLAAILMVLCVGLLVVFVTLANFVVSLLDSQLNMETVTRLASFGSTLVIGTLSLALIFKILPPASLGWKDVFTGGFVTALLLIGGANILGWYGSCIIIASAFEVAGTVAVFLISVYFLAQLLIFGMVFTRTYAELYGSGIRPRFHPPN
jgi:membrane protein